MKVKDLMARLESMPGDAEVVMDPDFVGIPMEIWDVSLSDDNKQVTLA